MVFLKTWLLIQKKSMGSTCSILRQRASLFTFLCSSLLLQTDSDQPVTKGDSAFSFHLIRVPDTCHSWRLEPLGAESTFQNQLQVPQMQPATTCVFFSGKSKLKATQPSAMCCLNLIIGVVPRCSRLTQIPQHFNGELMSGFWRQWSRWLLKHLLLLEIAVAIGTARGESAVVITPSVTSGWTAVSAKLMHVSAVLLRWADTELP